MSLGTPQQSIMVKQGLATVYYRVIIMMAHMELNENPRTDLWPEYATTMTKPETLWSTCTKKKCAYEKFYGDIPDYAKY